MNRRELLSWSVRGLGAAAVMDLLQRDRCRAADAEPDFRIPAKARRAVQISLIGGLSHLDSFDYKPKLADFHGKSLKTDTPPDIFFNQVGLLRQADWEFRQR